MCFDRNVDIGGIKKKKLTLKRNENQMVLCIGEEYESTNNKRFAAPFVKKSGKADGH